VQGVLGCVDGASGVAVTGTYRLVSTDGDSAQFERTTLTPIKVGDRYVRIDDPWQECIVREVKTLGTPNAVKVLLEAVGKHNKHRGAMAEFHVSALLNNWKPVS